jgi:hypothetical protein
MAEISQEEYDRWSEIYYRASTSLENRDEKVDEAAELIEKVSRFDVVVIVSYNFKLVIVWDCCMCLAHYLQVFCLTWLYILSKLLQL